jgi:hypothetical protein
LEFNPSTGKKGPPHSPQKTITNADGVEQKELPFIVGGNTKQCSHFGREFGSYYKVKHLTPYLVTTFLGIYLSAETYIQTKTCI